ncbi:DUF5947 family protein [Amycolatopsis sp. NPDC004368]
MTRSLRGFLTPVERPAPGERCDVCSERVGLGHGHVIDLESRTIMCTCHACYLLFTRTTASRRHRAVPRRYLHTEPFPAGAALWEAAGIPGRMAFAFYNSPQNHAAVCHPIPTGTKESLLPKETWAELLDTQPDVAPDVEAILINKRDTGFEAFLVPIDVCYELVALIRLQWCGPDGGPEAHEAIDRFFTELRDRAEAADG